MRERKREKREKEKQLTVVDFLPVS